MNLSIYLMGFTFARALAAPLVTPVEETVNTAIYLCDNRNFGHCFYTVAQAGICASMPVELNNKLSSVGPDEGSFCYFFVGPNCDADQEFFHLGYPGVDDLSKTPVNGPPGNTHNFEDRLSSFKCLAS